MAAAIRLRHLALTAALLSACGGDDSPARPSGSTGSGGAGGCVAGELELPDGACLAAGTQPNGCAAGEVGLDAGGCRPAGLTPELCSGVDELGACVPALPADVCPPGQMAAPGEIACRDVAPCGAGDWGDIPVDATTEHVDAAYAAGASDGSAAKPWTTIQDAVDAASPGAIVAVAAGTYAEDVDIAFKAVRLWGRCPKMVEVAGTSGGIGAVFVRKGAASTEIRDLAIRGGSAGLVLSGSEQVVADRVWIHDTGKAGVIVQDTFGPTAIAVTRSLVEAATTNGVFVAGAAVTLEASVVRQTEARSDELFGRGVAVQDDPDTGGRADVTIRASLVERNRDIGVFVEGSDATIEDSVIRETEPRASDQTFGQGLNVRDAETTGARSTVTVRSSVLSKNRATGAFLSASDVTIESSVVRDTQPEEAAQAFGWGVEVQCSDAGQRANVTVRASVVARNRALGIYVAGSDATIEGVLVADIQPQASDHDHGLGIQVQLDGATMQRTSATIRSSVVERALDAGILCAASDATIEASIVRGTLPRASDGAFGDGVAVAAEEGPASATVTASRIEGNARAGVSAFGATAAVGTTQLECNAFHLDKETFEASAPAFEDRGGNVCRCQGAEIACQVSSSNLAPPEAPVAP